MVTTGVAPWGPRAPGHVRAPLAHPPFPSLCRGPGLHRRRSPPRHRAERAARGGRRRSEGGGESGAVGLRRIAIPLYEIQVRPASLGGMENEIVDTTAESIEVEEELLVEEISIDGMCGVY